MAKKAMLLKLPPAVGHFVNVFKPRPPGPGPDAASKEKVYDVTLAWPKAEAARMKAVEVKDGKAVRTLTLAAAALEVAEATWPGKGEDVVRKMKHDILRDGDDKADQGLGGQLYVHAKRRESFGPPPVYDAKVQRVVTAEERDRMAAAGYDLSKLNPGVADDEAYAGCTFVAQVTLFAYDNPLGGKGVGVGLAGVQVVRKGPRIGGVRADERAFEEEPEDSGPHTDGQAAANPWD